MLKVYPLTAEVSFAEIKQMCETGIFSSSLIRLAPEFANHSPVVAEKLINKFGETEGAIFFLEASHIVLMLDSRSGYTPADIKREVGRLLSDIQYHLLVRHTSTGMLEKLHHALDTPMDERGKLFKERQERSSKVFMVVDDDMFIRKVISGHLENFGTVHEFSDGDKVVESYEEVNPDVVFLDIHIHGIDGLEVLKRIQAMDFDCKVVILSSDASESKVLLAQTSGASTFLRKPASKERIADCVKLAYFDV